MIRRSVLCLFLLAAAASGRFSTGEDVAYTMRGHARSAAGPVWPVNRFWFRDGHRVEFSAIANAGLMRPQASGVAISR